MRQQPLFAVAQRTVRDAGDALLMTRSGFSATSHNCQIHIRSCLMLRRLPEIAPRGGTHNAGHVRAQGPVGPTT